jgi:catechol 2,3-dioxygenase-like lactoylglutathione lyase family enzyme
MASGIKHIEIAVSDLGQSLDFYGKLFAILGWQRGKTNNFEIDDVSVYLKKWDFPKGRTLGARHICF